MGREMGQLVTLLSIEHHLLISPLRKLMVGSMIEVRVLRREMRLLRVVRMTEGRVLLMILVK
jgi:hypothetical protein